MTRVMWQARRVKLAFAAAAVLSVALLGCKKESGATTTPANATATAPAPDPTPAAVPISDAELEALMRELTTFMAGMAEAVEGAGKDCAAMAAGIDRVGAQHADVLARVRKLDDPAIEDRADAWMQANGEALNDLSTRVVTAVEPCGSDAGVQAALERVGT